MFFFILFLFFVQEQENHNKKSKTLFYLNTQHEVKEGKKEEGKKVYKRGDKNNSRTKLFIVEHRHSHLINESYQFSLELSKKISLKFKISSPLNVLTWRCIAIKFVFNF